MSDETTYELVEGGNVPGKKKRVRTRAQMDRQNELQQQRRASNDIEVRRQEDRDRYARSPSILAVKRAWREANPDKVLSASKAYRLAHPDRVRANQLKHRFGLTLEQWNALFDQQGACCAVCRTTDPGKRGWCVDHAHVARDDGSYFIRGILCNRCNIAIGMLSDNVEVMQRAIDYVVSNGAAIVVNCVNESKRKKRRV